MNDTPPSSPPTATLAVLGSHFPPGLFQVLISVRMWCKVVVLTVDVASSPLDALVVGRVGLMADHSVSRFPPDRVAVWVDDLVDLDRPDVASVATILSNREEVIASAGGRGLLAPLETAVSDGRPMAPHVRARLRAARGLPDCLVVEHDGQGWLVRPQTSALNAALGATALACASVAIVTGPALLDALVWGTPCVTDAASAAAVGARAGRDVLVGDDPTERGRVAREVAGRPELAGQLSRCGWQLVETLHSPACAAAHLIRRLGLGPASEHLVPDPMAARLAELGTPVDAVVATRAAAATLFLTADLPSMGA